MISPLARLQIDLFGSEKSSTLLDFSRLLYHLDRSYEIARLATDPKYREFEFPLHTFRRVVSPLDPSDQLDLLRVRRESPWQLSLTLQDVMTALGGGLGAFWLFIQCLEKLSMYRLNRAKVKAEIAKAILEVEKHKRELPMAEARPLKQLSDGTLERQKSGNPAKLEKSATELVQASDDNSILIPPRESVRPLKQLSDGTVERQKSDNPTKLEKLAAELVQASDDDSVLIPPRESVKAYNRLSNRGAMDLFEGNTRVLLKLGFDVRDLDVHITER